MKKTFGAILDRMTYVLKSIGINYTDMIRDKEIKQLRGHVFERGIEVKQGDLMLYVVVRAKIKPEAIQMNPYHPATKNSLSAQHNNYNNYGFYAGLPKNHHLRYKWSVFVRVLMRDNTYKLALKMRRENFGNKVAKFFGGRDLEVYNKDFDKLFWIEGNNTYVHATLLTSDLQEKLIEEAERFHELEIRNQYVIYYTPIERLVNVRTPKYQRHYKTLIETCLDLARNVNQWKPPME